MKINQVTEAQYVLQINERERKLLLFLLGETNGTVGDAFGLEDGEVGVLYDTFNLKED